MANAEDSIRDLSEQQSGLIKDDLSELQNEDEDGEEEEFLLHLKFDHGSYPLRHNVNEIEFMGIINGNLFVRIGDSYFQGEYDQRNNSSILFSYDDQTIYDTHKGRSKIFMKRILLKPKNNQHDQPESVLWSLFVAFYL